MWVRGLKLKNKYYLCRVYYVAPYVGAWIETTWALPDEVAAEVAPYVGAWIETIKSFEWYKVHRVAPYVGAWIETYKFALGSLTRQSHPMWVRGLKHFNRIITMEIFSRTLCGCVD